MQMYEMRLNDKPLVFSLGTRDHKFVDIEFYTDNQSGEWKPSKKITLNKQEVEKLKGLLEYLSKHLTT